jgi:hypothetical protein
MHIYVHMYNFINASASSFCLHRHDIAYNHLMRVILGIRHSIVDCHCGYSIIVCWVMIFPIIPPMVSGDLTTNMNTIVIFVLRTFQICAPIDTTLSAPSLLHYEHTLAFNAFHDAALSYGSQRIAVRGLKSLNQQSNGSSWVVSRRWLCANHSKYIHFVRLVQSNLQLHISSNAASGRLGTETDLCMYGTEYDRNCAQILEGDANILWTGFLC